MTGWGHRFVAYLALLAVGAGSWFALKDAIENAQGPAGFLPFLGLFAALTAVTALVVTAVDFMRWKWAAPQSRVAIRHRDAFRVGATVFVSALIAVVVLVVCVVALAQNRRGGSDVVLPAVFGAAAVGVAIAMLWGRDTGLRSSTRH